MAKRRLLPWSAREDAIAAHGHKLKMTANEIVPLLKVEGFIRTAQAILDRDKRLRWYAERAENQEIEPTLDMNGDRLDRKRAKRSDDKFQEVMQREGYQQHCSNEPGTESPKLVASTSVGSYTSSAGWAT